MTSKPDALTDAIAYEQAIADEAAEIREYHALDDLTPRLFLKLLPLLRRPIPAAFIETVGVVKGKPYVSTGIKSVQVQFDRMDNVLTPLWWRERCDYDRDGTLATVTVEIGPEGFPFLSRSSKGGVDRGSTVGNVYKGSYTNAAKLAFARVGPGHEVYIGVADLDPDVHEPTAKAQQASTAERVDSPMSAAAIKRVVDAFEAAGIVGEDFKLYLTMVGITDPADMTVAHAFALREALDERLAGVESSEVKSGE